jgi:integrase
VRTWQDVLDEFSRRGKPQTQEHRRTVSARKPFDLIRHQRILETTAMDFLAVLQKGGVMTQAFLRCVHNLALGLGWLPWAVLPPRLWPAVRTKPKRGITLEEHRRILAVEQNTERRHYYELVWEIGAAQIDAASLRAENIDWETRLLSYQRRKTGEWAYLKIGSRLEALLRQLPAKGPLFPRISTMKTSERSAEFSRRCRLLKLKGVSLHSYRYAWAERAKDCGYPERFAQQALGHGSKAVHRAYARGARVHLPPLEMFEDQARARNIVNLPVATNATPQEPAPTTPIVAAG